MALGGVDEMSWFPSSDPRADEQDIFIGTSDPPTTVAQTGAAMTVDSASRAAFAEPGELVYGRVVTRDTDSGETQDSGGVLLDMGGVVADLEDPPVGLMDGFMPGPEITWTSHSSGASFTIGSPVELVLSVSPNAHTGASGTDTGFVGVRILLEQEDLGSWIGYEIVTSLTACDDDSSPEIRVTWSPGAPAASDLRLRASVMAQSSPSEISNRFSPEAILTSITLVD